MFLDDVHVLFVFFVFVFCLRIRRPPRSTLDRSSAASDVYKRQPWQQPFESKLVYSSTNEGLSSGSTGPIRWLGQRLDSHQAGPCLLYTSPSPRDRTRSRMPSSA